jgi:hypothetical protein
MGIVSATDLVSVQRASNRRAQAPKLARLRRPIVEGLEKR